jgi:multidrug efflux pump
MLATVGLNVYLYIVVPKGFFPEQDNGRVRGNIQADQTISFQAMVPKLEYFLKQVLSDPAVDTVDAFAGGGGRGGGANTANMFMQLKPLEERKVSVYEVIDRLRRKTAGVPGANLFLQAEQDIRVGGRMSNALYQFTITSGDLKLLNEWAPKVLAKLRSLPELADVSSDQQNAGLSANVEVDRDTAARLGLTVAAVDTALYSAFGQRQVSTMYRSINQYHVIMEVAPEYWQDPSTLSKIYVTTTRGATVPLSSFTRFSPGTTPLSIPHHGQFPAVTLSFNLRPNVSLGQAVDAISRTEEEMGMPATIVGKFAGTAQAYQDSLANEPVLIATALIAVYIVLGMLYESLIHPLTILSTLPSAGVGALIALILCHTELTVIALIGIILLIGLVKKNAILMIDFALAAERNEGKNSREAIYEACILRFRPIMMTTMAALFGGLPLALGTGTGSEMRRPLGIAIVGGLIVSQALTLFTTPVIYLFLDRLRTHAVNVRPRRRRPGILIPGGAAESAD